MWSQSISTRGMKRVLPQKPCDMNGHTALVDTHRVMSECSTKKLRSRILYLTGSLRSATCFSGWRGTGLRKWCNAYARCSHQEVGAENNARRDGHIKRILAWPSRTGPQGRCDHHARGSAPFVHCTQLQHVGPRLPVRRVAVHVHHAVGRAHLGVEALNHKAIQALCVRRECALR